MKKFYQGAGVKGVIFTGTASKPEEAGPNKTDLGQQQRYLCPMLIYTIRKNNH